MIALEPKDAVIPISRFRAFDELDVDLMGICLDIYIKDSFVNGFGRFSAKPIAIDQNAGVC